MNLNQLLPNAPLNSHIVARITAWCESPSLDEASKKQVYTLISEKKFEELAESFGKDLEFGTGGLRAPMGAGDNRMNIYTVGKAACALGLFVKKKNQHSKEQQTVAISYDMRLDSEVFAKRCVEVLAGLGIKSYLFSEITPTPLLSYAVRKTKSAAGIMITASHNPPIYNGFKAYGADGAQMIPPDDETVMAEFLSLNDYGNIPSCPFDEAKAKGLYAEMPSDVEESYYQDMLKTSFLSDKKTSLPLKVIYTPLHGTGTRPVQELCSRWRIPTSLVSAQVPADPYFSTVKSPNPEEASALAMATESMLQSGADLAFGTDPDADRLGVVVNHERHAHFLNGNQIGLLLAHYILTRLQERGELKKHPYYLVKTIVSSPAMEKLAAQFGVKCYQTLTGFKWICGLMRELENKAPEERFAFGSEESFGYLVTADVRDKDGVSALAMMSECAAWWKEQQKTLVHGLEDIYNNIGLCHEELLSLTYQGAAGSERIQRIMSYFRTADFKWPTEMCGPVLFRQDFAAQTQEALDGSFKGQAPDFPHVPKSNVLGLMLAGGDRVMLRPSGTEPKIKFYIMLSGDQELDALRKKAQAMAKWLHSLCDQL
jgi:phosphoglucomutase